MMNTAMIAATAAEIPATSSHRGPRRRPLDPAYGHTCPPDDPPYTGVAPPYPGPGACEAP
jgi:hypothetical protein